MAKKSIKKNYIYNVCYRVMLLFTPVITIPYISRVLEADGVGIVSYAEAIVSYFTLFAALGTGVYGQREISYVQECPQERTRIFWEIKLLEFCTAGIALAIYIFFAIRQDNPYIYLAFSFSILAVLADVTWFFQGMEEFGKVVAKNTVFKLINIAWIFLTVRDKDDLIFYALGIALFVFLGNVSLWMHLPQYLCKVEKDTLHPFKRIGGIISLFVPTIAIQVYTVLDKTMIGLITGDPCENGYYAQALKVSSMLLTVVTAMGAVIGPRVGYHFQQGETENVRSLMHRAYQFVWFLGIPLCLGLVLVADNFAPWFFGDGYDKTIMLLRLLAIQILAIGISNVTGIQYMVPTKRQNLLTVTVVTGAVCNFCMNLFLIRYLQSVGAAIASVIAEYIIAVFQLVLMRKELSIWDMIKSSKNYLIAGSVMVMVLLPMSKSLSATVIHTVSMVICGAGVYFTALLVLRDSFFLVNLKSIFDKIGEKTGLGKKRD